MVELPSGTVTFLLTDIESSSSHWEENPDTMRAALAVHDQVVGDTLSRHGGMLLKHTGDGNWCIFRSAQDAARAAIDIQQQLQAQPEEILPLLSVRIGLHTGDVTPTNGDYFGSTPNRIARVTDLANGGQVVCSSASAGLLQGFDLRSAGEHELRGIGVDEVFVLTSAEFVTDTRPLRRPVVPNNLPHIPTSFLGREDDVEQVITVLGKVHGVVTLLGPGGVGKTRLAVEVGRRVATSTRSAVVFCDLAAVREADDVVAAVADAIGARQQPGMDLLESIADYVLDRELLVILDNCEQVVGVVGRIVERLAAAQSVDVLATSRAALRVSGEQLFDVAPLDPVEDGFELFVSRATEHDATFELSAGDAELIREITLRLDGIPLAIELAAARVRLMSPAELVAGLDDRFSILRAGNRGGRQETLRDTVMWSYKLLSPEEAAVFNRMSVFAGGATLNAISQVCADDDLVTTADVPDIVLSLVEQSMLVGRTVDGHRRFRLLETMRGFGDEQLVESAERAHYRRKHAEYFAALAAAQSNRIFSPDEPDAWRIIDAEWSNLRLTLDSLRDSGRVEAAVGLVLDLVQYATFSMRFELFSWADELLALPEIEGQPHYADLCGAAAVGAYVTANGRATALAETGLAANPDDPMGLCRLALASIFLNNVHTPEASDEVTSALLATNPESTAGRLWAEGFRTFHLCSHGFPEEAVPHAAAIVQLARETGSISAHALASWAQGLLVTYTDLDAAITIWDEAREAPRVLPRDHLTEHLLVGLILHFTVQQHDVGDALGSCRAALQSAIDGHYYAGASHLFGVTAIALSRADDPETGAKLVGAMIGNGHRPRSNATQALERALGDEIERWQTVGSALSVTQAAHIALEAIDEAIERSRSMEQAV